MAEMRKGLFIAAIFALSTISQVGASFCACTLTVRPLPLQSTSHEPKNSSPHLHPHNLACSPSAVCAKVYVGVKCISFVGIWQTSRATLTLQGALFGATVLLINLEAWLVKRMVNAVTGEVGHYVPEFHSHPLYFMPDMPRSKCDLCRTRVSLAPLHAPTRPMPPRDPLRPN